MGSRQRRALPRDVRAAAQVQGAARGSILCTDGATLGDQAALGHVQLCADVPPRGGRAGGAVRPHRRRPDG